jgi:hypothetical protein
MSEEEFLQYFLTDDQKRKQLAFYLQSKNCNFKENRERAIKLFGKKAVDLGSMKEKQTEGRRLLTLSERYCFARSGSAGTSAGKPQMPTFTIPQPYIYAQIEQRALPKKHP